MASRIPGNVSLLDLKPSFNQDYGVIEPRSCAVIIPCLNEEATISPLVAALRQEFPLIIVVDDGSTDKTSLLAREAGASVLRHPRNCGKGAALRTGLSEARRQGAEWGFTLDGDGQHAPDDSLAFLRCADQTKAQLVVGDRMRQAHAMPWIRRQVNVWMSRQLSRRAGKPLPDSQCGFRLVHLETWASLSLETERFEVESEMLMAFLAAGHRVEFVPIRVIGQGRGSHISSIADTLRWWRWWRGLPRASQPKQ